MGSTDPDRVRILGVGVDTIDRAGVEAAIAAALSASGAPLHIVTYNPEYAMAARRDAAFLAALQAGDIVTADGVGIVLAARLHRGAPAIERITGVDLLSGLASLSAKTGSGIFLLGAGAGVAPRAASALSLLHPNARFTGWWWEGTPAPDDDAETLRWIKDSGASMLAVAYGAPGQIHWIERNLERLGQIGVRVVIGIGGALDFWAGDARRAPKLMRRLGLEWLYRLIREPWRWRRQLVLPMFAVLATVEGLKSWLPGGKGTALK